MNDHIHINNLVVQGHIGVDESERESKQEIRISLELRVDLSRVAETDRLEDSVDYHELTYRISELVDRSSWQTMEALAGDLLDICLAPNAVDSVTVRVEKPEAIPNAESAAVEMTRSRDSS